MSIQKVLLESVPFLTTDILQAADQGHENATLALKYPLRQPVADHAVGRAFWHLRETALVVRVIFSELGAWPD